MMHEINEENDDALSIQTVTVIMNRIENPNGNITGMKDSLKIKEVFELLKAKRRKEKK